MTEQVAVWLVPTPPWRERFRARIDELARAFGSIAFEPHITLHVGRLANMSAALAQLAALSTSYAPLTLTCDATMHSDEHFKTLFITFHDAGMERLRDAIVTVTKLDGDYALQPHLSLLYRGALDLRERERVASAHRYEGERVAFDQIVLVRARRPDGDLYDIAGLDTSARWRLSGT